MHRRQLLALLILVLGVVPCPAGEADWKFDVVHLKNGRVYKGLLVREAPEEIKFRCVTRKSGAPTTVMFTVFSRAEIDHVDLLGPKDRERLIERLQALDPHGKAEKSKWESLKLEPAPWGKAGKLKALRYESTYFILISDAREEMVRRAALCLEQIYAGYAGLLPPHRKALKPTTVYLCKSTDRYKALLRERGLGNLINPACFLPGRNEVLCGSDLEDVGVELAEINKKYKKAVKAHKKDFANFIQQSQGNLAPGMADKYQNLWKSLAKENAEDNGRALRAPASYFKRCAMRPFTPICPTSCTIRAKPTCLPGSTRAWPRFSRWPWSRRGKCASAISTKSSCFACSNFSVIMPS